MNELKITEIKKFLKLKNAYEYDLSEGLISETIAYDFFIDDIFKSFNYNIAFDIFILNLDKYNNILKTHKYEDELEIINLDIERIKEMYLDKIIEKGDIKRLYFCAVALSKKSDKKAIEKLEIIQDKIIKSGNAKYIFGYARDVVNANIDKLRMAIDKTNDIQYKILFLLLVDARRKLIRKEEIKKREPYIRFVLEQLKTQEENDIISKDDYHKCKIIFENALKASQKIKKMN